MTRVQGTIAVLLLSLFHLSQMHVKLQLQKGEWQIGCTARGQAEGLCRHELEKL